MQPGCYATWLLALDLAPTPEDQAAEREAEPERPDREAADRRHFARLRETLPAAECLFLLGRQLLAAALLPQSAAGPETEVEVVEDLGGLVAHIQIYSLIRSWLHASSIFPISTRVHVRTVGSNRRWPSSSSRY